MDTALTIVHTEASDGWGGQEIRILSEAKWFRAQGHRVVLVAPAHAQLTKRVGEAGFETHVLPFTKGSQALDVFRLGRLLRQLRPQVLGTHSSVDSWVGLLAGRMCGVPALLRYRHVSTPVKPNWPNRWQYRSLCEHTLTTGECIRQALIESTGVAPERVTSVPTGIEPPKNLPEREAARLALCGELKVPPTSRFLGCVAVLRSWKGQSHLMAAFDSLADKFPEHHLVLVGDGPGWEGLNKVKDQMKARERIIFTGHQSDPWRFFRGFDAAVLPSTKNEGIPQSLLQAMFAECPVLGSQAGGIPEIVRQGETGLLVPPADAGALALGLEEILRKPEEAQRRVRAALEFVRRGFLLEGMGRKVLGIIQGCLGGVAGSPEKPGQKG